MALHKSKCALSLHSGKDNIVRNANDWYGTDSTFEGLSFNPLSVENELEWAVNQKNNVIKGWTEWEINMQRLDMLKPGSSNKNIAFEFGDNLPPSTDDTSASCGVRDPRVMVIGSGTGPGSTQPPQAESTPTGAPQKFESNISTISSDVLLRFVVSR